MILPSARLRVAVQLLSLIGVAVGCGGAPPAVPVKTSLVRVDAIPKGPSCQYGGVTLTAGVDTNSNGVLDPAEIISTTPVCNGPQTDPKALVKVTMLAVGSALCPTGGSQIETGLDNGDGGGTAGNAMLEIGEVDSTDAICNGPLAGTFDLGRPAGDAGTAHINLNGGGRTGGVTVTGTSGAGAIDAHGGTGGTSRGAGGTLNFRGFGDAELRAPIDLGGGSSAMATPTEPGSLRVDTTGAVTAAGTINVNGTDQAVLVANSRGGRVTLFGLIVKAIGSISARGGNATSGRPGDGGAIVILSRGVASVVTGALDVAAGTGASGAATNFAALPGTITIDGLAK